MVRGFSYGGTIYPITDFTANYNRNLITEQGMGLGGEPTIYDGANIVTGSIGAVYRDSFAAFASPINNLLSGSSSTISTSALVASDEFGGGSFPSSFVNSFELTCASRDIARVNMGFVSKGPVTSSTVATAATYTAPVPIFWACAFKFDSTVIKATSVSLRLEVPIDQDFYVIGNKYLDDIVQSGNGSLTGSISFGTNQWSYILDAMGSCGDIDADIILDLNGQSASNCTTSLIRTITITDAVASDSSFSGQNRNRFTKTLNWRAPVATSTNNALFS